MRKAYLLLSLLFCLLFSVGAQNKVYKKEIFPLLEAKSYQTAIPQLKQYLKDPDTREEASPNYQYGLYIEKRFLAYDVIQDSAKLYAAGDSAVNYLNLAKSLVTEKELKKNDELWQAFYRRDLRTGKFGIKVSDVHLDIEKQVEKIQQRVADAKSLTANVQAIESELKQIQIKYVGLTSSFESYNSFLLKAGDDEKTTLEEIISGMETVKAKSEALNKAAKSLNSELYTDALSKVAIEVYGEDGSEGFDIRTGTIKTWDYDGWARDAKIQITGSVVLFKSSVTKRGEDLKAQKKLLASGQQVETRPIATDLVDQFNKYDPESTALQILLLEEMEVALTQLLNPATNPMLLDSLKRVDQAATYNQAVSLATKMYDQVGALDLIKVDAVKELYPSYTAGFGDFGSATAYVLDMKKWSLQQKVQAEDAKMYWEEQNNWGISESDSISLVTNGTVGSNWRTLGVPIKTNDLVIAYGIDQENGAFAMGFGADRKAVWNLTFDVSDDLSQNIRYDSVPTADGSIGFYVYDSSLSEDNLLVASFTESGTSNWSALLTTEREPVSFDFDAVTQELTLFFYPKDELPLDPANPGYTIIDYTGNVR